MNKQFFYEDETMARWFETVTPESATDYLNKQSSNRILSMPTVFQYAEDMKRGGWVATHQNAIALDNEGNLFDGQHKLNAVIMAKRNIQMEFCQYKTRETVNQAQLVIDSGRNRTNGDKAQILFGMTNAHRKMAAIVLLKMIVTGWSTTASKISLDRRMNIYRRFEERLDFIGANRFPAYINAPLVFIYKNNIEVVTDIVERLRTGAHLEHKSPILTIRNFMQSPAGKGGGGSDGVVKTRRIFNGLKAEVKGQNLTRLMDSNNGQIYFCDRQPQDIHFLEQA